MSGKVNLARAALILASIWNQNKPMVVEIDNLAQRKVACSHYHGPFGVEAFRTFKKLRNWHRSGNVIEVDRFLRPFALGIHLNTPFETAIQDVNYWGCIWIPNDSSPVATSEVKIFQLLGGPHVRSDAVLESIENTWTTVYALEKQLPTLPGGFMKDPKEAGWWEHYSPESWDKLINGYIRSAAVGFRVVRGSSRTRASNSTVEMIDDEEEEDNYEVLGNSNLPAEE